MPSDQRRFPRIPQSFDAQYRLPAVDETWHTMQTVNLSATGMRFRSGELLEIGTSLEVRIKLPNMQRFFELQGHIMWSQMQASGVVEHGMEFVNLGERQQKQIDELVEFLRHG